MFLYDKIYMVGIMKFKKIYIEITNMCNLNCSFCLKKSRRNRFLKFEEFKLILKKIKPYTSYLYFHILGEPLLHPLINDFIDYATDMGFFVNITTNGYLIDRIKKNKNIRQINISLHSYDEKYCVNLKDYLNGIFNISNKLSNNTYISYRLWTNNKYNKKIIALINNHYNLNIDDSFTNIKLAKNIYINQQKEFIWPSKDGSINDLNGKCYGLIDHIGILSDGTIVPCCLDGNGIINLGNIFSDNLEDILISKRVKKIIDGFKENKKIEELCQKCNFNSRLN